MTIREIQELIRFMDEKREPGCRASLAMTDEEAKDDVCRRFCELVRDANAAGIDLTGCLVEWLGQKKY